MVPPSSELGLHLRTNRSAIHVTMSVSSRSTVSEEEEDEEPILKYSRFEGSLPKILADDSVSAFTLCSKYIVLGSHNGLVYILNLQGAEVRKYRAHSAAVSGVSIDKDGAIVASASIDGRVITYNIAKKETSMYDFKRPLRSVSIDPEYYQNGKARLISGGMAGQLILTEKGWMGNKETIMSANEGPILETAWCGHLVAWSNDMGVRVYDILNMRMVGIIERRPGSPRADLFKCRLLWQEKSTLIIGWFDHVTRVSVQEGVGKVLNLDTTYIMKMDCVVSGLAMFGGNLLVMAYLTDLEDIQNPSTARGTSERPEIRMINSDFEEISEDALGLRGYEKLQPNDYTLFTNPVEDSFFVISPKDIVSARKRDVQDHILWLLEAKKYDMALEASQKSTGLPLELSYGEVGRQFMAHLCGEHDYKKAAELAPKVLLEDVEDWEKFVFMYAEKGHLEDITPFMPVEHPTLSSVVYEMALGQYLSSNSAMLITTIQKWPVEIYNVDDIAKAIEHRLAAEKQDKLLKEALAVLYVKTDRPRDALPHYLALGKSETFELIRSYHLYDAVQDNIMELMTLGVPAAKAGMTPLSLANPEAVQLLVQHAHSIPTQKVVNQLRDRPALLYCYFQALHDYDPQLAVDYSDLQISLYAEYDRTKLMALLKSTRAYSLENAAKICESRDYIPELVYILGKTGNNKKALRLIIEKLRDVQQAIAFAFTQADPELWEDLIRYSLDKPAFIRGLLENAGSAISSISLIRRIPPGLVIEGLKDSLTKIFSDYDLQMSLSQCGSSIHRSEISGLSNQLRAGQRRGLSISASRISELKGENLYIFFNGRVVSTKELGIESSSGTGDSSAVAAKKASGRRIEARRKRQSTAGKITESAINKSKVLSYTTP